MKSTITAIICLAGVSLLSSCDRTPDVSGTWGGTAVSISQTGVPGVSGTLADAQIANSLTFIPATDNKHSGNVELLSEITLIDAVPFDSTLVAPYEISVSAIATATGTYRFTDDDEMIIAIDPGSIRVSVDPEAVTYSENVLTGDQAPAIDSIRPSLADAYRVRLLPLVRNEYGAFQSIDDIKVHSDMMSCEINDRDYTFRRK